MHLELGLCRCSREPETASNVNMLIIFLFLLWILLKRKNTFQLLLRYMHPSIFEEEMHVAQITILWKCEYFICWSKESLKNEIFEILP
jgi:hypothetical protein